MTTKHTPWTISFESNGAFIYADEDPRKSKGAIAHVYKDCVALAPLIAAAPELLAELELAQKMIQDVALWAGDGETPPSKRLEAILRCIGPGNRPAVLTKAKGEV